MAMPIELVTYRSRRTARRDRLVVRVAVLLCALIAGFSALLAVTGTARAEQSAYDGLYLKPMARDLGEGETVPKAVAAPRLAQTVRLDIAGVVARGTVAQVFRNDSPHWVEGEYRFPLPDGAAVDDLTIRVADRVVAGEIQPREEAKQTYETAKREGRTAALLDENRPNLFSLKLANIAPGEAIAVELGFQASVTRDGDAFSFKMPLVAAPRYLPEMNLAAIDHPALRAAIAKQLEDAERLGFPIDLSRQSNPTALEVALDAGADLATLESPSHDLVVSRDGEKYRIGLRLGAEPADRDMVLRWQTEREAMPGAALFHERIGETDYLLAMIRPPEAEAARAVARPRDVTFVIDSSGSMYGEAMNAAQLALAEAIVGLTPADRFDVIDFDDDYQALFGSTRPAERAAKEAAIRFAARLEADGGTEMRGPLRAALATGTDGEALRQIVFLTDGLVGNEDELFGMIGANLRDARLFTVGLGPAPNGWFMRKAAELGAGQNLSIATVAEAGPRMKAFYEEISVPVVTDLMLDTSGEAEVYPARLPDLYGARALLVPVAIENWDGRLSLSGTLDGKPWTVTLTESDLRPAAGIAKLWAERKVEDLMDSIRRGEVTEDEGRAAVLEVALPHKIATRYTSFVAVDREVRRPEDAPSERGVVPNNQPQGMNAAMVAGPAGADGWMLRAQIGFALIGGSLLLLLVARKRQT